jgi:hypothetical protein
MSVAGRAEGTPVRFEVRSPDGTALAVWVEGDGPALVLAAAYAVASPPYPFTQSPPVAVAFPE